jgi:hypothetical protein
VGCLFLFAQPASRPGIRGAQWLTPPSCSGNCRSRGSLSVQAVLERATLTYQDSSRAKSSSVLGAWRGGGGGAVAAAVLSRGLLAGHWPMAGAPAQLLRRQTLADACWSRQRQPSVLQASVSMRTQQQRDCQQP